MPSHFPTSPSHLTHVPQSPITPTVLSQPISIHLRLAGSSFMPLLSSLFNLNLTLYLYLLPVAFLPVNLWTLSYFCSDLLSLPVRLCIIILPLIITDLLKENKPNKKNILYIYLNTLHQQKYPIFYEKAMLDTLDNTLHIKGQWELELNTIVDDDN